MYYLSIICFLVISFHQLVSQEAKEVVVFSGDLSDDQQFLKRWFDTNGYLDNSSLTDATAYRLTKNDTDDTDANPIGVILDSEFDLEDLSKIIVEYKVNLTAIAEAEGEYIEKTKSKCLLPNFQLYNYPRDDALANYTQFFGDSSFRWFYPFLRLRHGICNNNTHNITSRFEIDRDHMSQPGKLLILHSEFFEHGNQNGQWVDTRWEINLKNDFKKNHVNYIGENVSFDTSNKYINENDKKFINTWIDAMKLTLPKAMYDGQDKRVKMIDGLVVKVQHGAKACEHVRPVEITIDQDETRNVTLGRQAVLNCTVNNHRVGVSWLRKFGQEEIVLFKDLNKMRSSLSPSFHVRKTKDCNKLIYSLVIDDLRDRDQGQYICRVKKDERNSRDIQKIVELRLEDNLTKAYFDMKFNALQDKLDTIRKMLVIMKPDAFKDHEHLVNDLNVR